jgi:hypothetical protein
MNTLDEEGEETIFREGALSGCGTKIKLKKLQRHFSKRCLAERMSTADEVLPTSA